jgi:hypothetical protein
VNAGNFDLPDDVSRRSFSEGGSLHDDRMMANGRRSRTGQSPLAITVVGVIGAIGSFVTGVTTVGGAIFLDIDPSHTR